MAGKVTDLTSIPVVNRATNVMEIVDVSGNASYKVTPNTLLGLAGNPVGDTDSQTITNKTLTAPTLNSPILGGTITGTYTLAGTPTFPSSVVTLTGTQTLTNKILTSATLSSPTLTNASITADAITGYTTATSGTIFGVGVTSGVITGNNTVNNNALSNTGTFGSAWAWQSWVPTYTNFTAGNGVLKFAKYTQVGKAVTAQLFFTLGSTSAMTGSLNISLPVTANSTQIDTNAAVNGVAVFQKTGTATYYGAAYLNTSTTVTLRPYLVSASNIAAQSTSSTIPHTWASTDIFSFIITYEGA